MNNYHQMRTCDRSLRRARAAIRKRTRWPGVPPFWRARWSC